MSDLPGNQESSAEGDFDAQVAAMQKEIAALKAKESRTDEENARLQALERDLALEEGEIDEKAKDV